MSQISVTGSTKILFLDNIEEDEEKINFEYRITNIVALGVLTLEEKVNFDKIEELIDVRYLNRFPCILFKLLGVSIIIFKKLVRNMAIRYQPRPAAILKPPPTISRRR